MDSLKKLGEEGFFDLNINYYPKCIFSYLTNRGLVGESTGSDSTVDVVLYPFTADVLPAGDKRNSLGLAKNVRESATRAFLSLILGDERGELDLKWYFF